MTPSSTCPSCGNELTKDRGGNICPACCDDRTALTLAIDIKDLPKPTESKDDQRFYQRVADLLSRLRIIHELIEAGASTTVVPAEYTSLVHYARDRGCPEIAELLENPPSPKPRKP